MKIIGVIPARYGSTRLEGKPLVDICGKPMVWWVYQQAKKVDGLSEVIVATDDNRVGKICDENDMRWTITDHNHDTPTSRICEVADKMPGNDNYYMFISGDEPLIDKQSIEKIVNGVSKYGADAINAMIKIKRASDVIDSTNIKVVTNSEGYLLYATRSPLPYPNGGLDFDYMKFVGLGAFSRKALKVFETNPRSRLESIEECDLLRFIEKGIKVKMIEVDCESLSVDTPKDLEIARNRIGGVLNS